MSNSIYGNMHLLNENTKKLVKWESHKKISLKLLGS